MRSANAGALAQWEVMGTLGVGAGGPVSEVRHRLSGRFGALKRARDTAAITRMRAEAEALHAVRHPRLVALLDHGEEEDGGWLVFERLGAPASTVFARGEPMAPAEVAALGRDVLEALAALHTAGFVHRDVKPANILKGTDNRWTLGDLGSCHVPGSSLTLTGSTLGTPAFMAPEQRHGSRIVGPAADLYALGATLWSLLRAELPYELHAADDRAWRGLPEPLRGVIRRATHLDPASRWESATHMAGALTPPGELRPAAPSRGWRVGIALGVLVAGAAWRAAGPGLPPSPPTQPDVQLRALEVGGAPDARLGTSLRSGIDIGGAAAEDVAIGSPGDHVGGSVILFEDGDFDMHNNAFGTRIPGLAFGTSVALLPRPASGMRGGLVIGGPSGDGKVDRPPPASGQVFLRDDYLSAVGTTLQGKHAQSFGEAGAAVEAWRTSSGVTCVAYGAPGARRGDVPEAGQVVLIDDEDRTWSVILGDEAGARLGAALARADLDGDGSPELIVGAPGARGGAGCVAAFALPEVPAPDPVSVATGLSLGCGGPGEAYGAALVGAGDTDGDGREEVWIGAPNGDRVVRVDARGVRATVSGDIPGALFGAAVHARADAPGALWVGSPAAAGGRGAAWAFQMLEDGAYAAGEADLHIAGSAPTGALGTAIAAQRGVDGTLTVLIGAPGEAEAQGRVWGMRATR